MKYLLKDKNCLVWTGTKSDSKFWDKLWNSADLKKEVEGRRYDFIVLPTTKKFLKSGSSVLEGGCGHGTFVYSLQKNGFKATGVDYAKSTVGKIKKAYPKLNVFCQDLRKLKFKDSSFDGYWSIGVIEHFFDGYEEIISEARRVLKKGGYLFITFPYMSPLRRIKSSLNLYPVANFKEEPEDFYQFALNHKQVIDKITSLGFTLAKTKPFDGYRGVRSDLSFLDFVLEPIDKYSKGNMFVLGLRFILGRLAQPFASHSILIVFRKD